MISEINIVNPLVSVVMTAYNRNSYIGDAIESVLSSTYKNFELIIVDDASSDNTVEIAKSYEVKDSRVRIYVNEKNLGDYSNRNRAASYARGKYLKYVDSDDMIYPETIDFMVNEMEKNLDAGLGFSSRSSLSTIVYSPKEAYRCHFFERGILDIGPTSIIYNREKFEKIGGFKTLRNVSDFDLNLRIAAIFNVVEMKKGLVYWREHSEQEIRIDPDKYLEYGLKIIQSNMHDPRCPLSKEDIKIVIKQTRQLYAIGIVKGMLKTGYLKKYFSFWVKNKLSVKDFF